MLLANAMQGLKGRCRPHLLRPSPLYPLSCYAGEGKKAALLSHRVGEGPG
jgi:hypothetical protein